MFTQPEASSWPVVANRTGYGKATDKRPRHIARMCDPIRVLIVDDELLVRWALASMLIHYGCIVVQCDDAASATRALAESSDPFDVILLDYNLPDSRDVHLLTTVKRLAPSSTVMMLSAHMTREEADEAIRLGASAVVPKPFDLDAVWELIRRGRSRK